MKKRRQLILYNRNRLATLRLTSSKTFSKPLIIIYLQSKLLKRILTLEQLTRPSSFGKMPYITPKVSGVLNSICLTSLNCSTAVGKTLQQLLGSSLYIVSNIFAMRASIDILHSKAIEGICNTNVFIVNLYQISNTF